MRLENQVIIVTGGGSGIGLAYAQGLCREGAKVVVSDLGDASPDVDSLLDAYPESVYIPADVRSAEQIRELVRTVISKFGRIDALINNAALFSNLERRPFEELELVEWEEVLRVNVIGTAACAREVVPVMKSQQRGRIINIASNVVHKGLPNLMHYVASKGAVVAMTRSLARELGSHGITVNAVAPGYVLHEATAESDGGRNEQVVKLRSIPRTQTPDDLIGTIVFLCSDDSEFITGQTFVVDGGEIFA